MSIQALARKTAPAPFAPADLASLIAGKEAVIGVIGMGYVGQPLAIAAHSKGFRVIGFDIDPAKVEALNAGKTMIRTIPDERIANMLTDGRFRASGDLSELSKADVIVICVPTPLSKFRDPDLSFVEGTARAIAKALRPGQLISLESTTYPGTTREVVQPILEATGLKVGRDIFLAFSPEREDPGNKDFHTANIPKVVGADDDASRELAEQFYNAFVPRIVPVSSSATAEAVKLTENIFRCVNIALVNELKHVYEQMGVNVWDVIDAAATKPFGFMPFYPGPGLGGHCIPVDPFYLSWKAREFDVPTRFIELAGEINTAEPLQVIAKLSTALAARKQLALNGARVLLIGLAYKKNVSDLRESPALTIMERLVKLGAKVEYYDPWVPVVPETREHASLANRRSIAWEPERFTSDFDAALIVTDHDSVDYAGLVSALDLVVDTRNATRNVIGRLERVVLA
jgi:UDP-N-acetyl-D-glucosamine dehydrogenase